MLIHKPPPVRNVTLLYYLWSTTVTVAITTVTVAITMVTGSSLLIIWTHGRV